MPLSEEKIQQLLTRPAYRNPPLAIEMAYPPMEENEYVKYNGGQVSMRCKCGCPTYESFEGTPMCRLHIVNHLISKLNSVTKNGNSSST